MNRHHTRRPPKKNPGFSWGRFPVVTGGNVTGVEWRLFRRDNTGKLHFDYRFFPVGESPALIAVVLRRARNQLRDTVDAIDLAAWGIAA